MSATIDYTVAVRPMDIENLYHAINGVAATVGAAAEILETIIESDDLQAATVAHGVAELLHLQNSLLGSLAVLLPKSAAGSPGGAT